MARRPRFEPVPIGEDPDPVGRFTAEAEQEGADTPNFLDRFIERAREQRQTDTRQNWSPEPAVGPQPPEIASSESETELPPVIEAPERNLSSVRRQAITDRAKQMGHAPLRSAGFRIPVDLDRWMERLLFEHEDRTGEKVLKQDLFKLAIQRLFIETELRNRLPTLED